MNLKDEGGISRSLFNKDAMIPRIKNSSTGFVMFTINKSKFIKVYFNAAALFKRSFIVLPNP